MAEDVRLVVWDLDETFWKGTVTEGGIQEYVQENHDIVIELARRGIMSSICSKNDSATILPILQEKGILEYFIFPSISWDPKGPRLAQLVETVQLRAPTIMFIDDNPNNRAEAVAVVPGLQVEDENFIPKLLADSRFKGKNDGDLTRLKQYRLLEKRKRDEKQTAGGNEEFLRSCDIRVYIEYDVEAHIDRAIELINRTNQLNYTKKRLPEDPILARDELRKQLRPFDRVAGLIHVLDKYGDYGFVGFFMCGTQRKKIELGAANANLIHYCFSCRTLGMLVEQWVYNYLNRPELDVRGEVITKLSNRSVDWIREVKTLDDATVDHPKIAPQIIFFGGCEANSIAAYLRRHTEKLDIYGNYVANGIMMRVNYAHRMLDISDRDPAQVAGELEALGLPSDLETGDIFNTAAHGALFVVNFAIDADGGPRLKHRRHHWSFAFDPPWMYWERMLVVGDLELAQTIDQIQGSSEQEKLNFLKIAKHIRSNYTKFPGPDEHEVINDTRQVIERIPLGAKLVILIDQDLRRDKDDWNKLISRPKIKRYQELVQELTNEYPYLATIPIAECVQSTDEIFEANHYDRSVYFRISQRIIEANAALKARETKTVPKDQIANRLNREIETERFLREARDFVAAVYQVLLRREPEEGLVDSVSEHLLDKRTTPADYIRAIGKCQEFSMKWKAVNTAETVTMTTEDIDSPKAEPVRLVIWDLDETFWHGTLTEGGIRLRKDTVEIVKELASRGIVSSICSKNDISEVKNILQTDGIWDYFVLPSINWEPKGPRVLQLIENIQLRPATVMFIDDNPINLEEVRHFVPSIQTKSHEFIPEILSNALFKGKADPDLKRLLQYKLLEQRKADEQASPGGTEEFLRASNIRVCFDYNVVNNLDRAIELINRTNQLNFTKARLSEDLLKARQELTRLVSSHEVRAALVGVKDNYGDHGWCGIYVQHNNGRLLHFAFSCRILGMYVETWLYNKLGRPSLEIQGEVLSDLDRNHIDWISIEDGLLADAQRSQTLVKRVIARGGCDLMPVAHYLRLIADEVIGEFNDNRFGMDGRIDHSTFLRVAFSSGLNEDEVAAAGKLGYQKKDFQSAIADTSLLSETWLLSFWTDAAYVLYRHRKYGFVVPFSLSGYHGRDARLADLETLRASGVNEKILEAVTALKNDYDFLGFIDESNFKETMRKIFSSASSSTMIFVLGANEYFINSEGVGQIMNLTRQQNAWIFSVAKDFPNVSLLNIRDYVISESEVHSPYHFDRMVYYRLFESIKHRLIKGNPALNVPHWAIHERSDLDAALAEVASPEILSRTAQFLLADGRSTEALPFARKATELDPASITYKLAYFDALLRPGGNASPELIRMLLESRSDLPGSVLHKIGVFLAEMGELSHAVTAFESAAAREPGMLHHRHRLGNVKEKLGQTREAYAILKSCLDDGDENPHVMAHCIRLLTRHGELEQARLLLERCLRLDDKFPPFLAASAMLADKELEKIELTALMS